MVKTLRQIGNSYGIIIEKPIMDLLGIDSQTQLEVSVQDGALLLRPIREADRKGRIRKSAARMAGIHRESLKELAD
jgi:antitoxin MazE